MAKASWIKCYRSLMDSEIWADEWLVKLWLWCLFKANHKPQTFKGVAIARGQFVTGRHTAADELGVSPSKWYRGIERLVGLGCIETAANKHWTTITVCNYTTYQDSVAVERTTDEQQMDNKRTTDEQPADTRERMTEGKNDRSKQASTQGDAPHQLKTWTIPAVAAKNHDIVTAIDRWQAYIANKEGRPWDDIRLEQTLANKLSEGWTAKRLIQSIAKSIEWGAKTWRDPEHDFDKKSKPIGTSKEVSYPELTAPTREPTR